MPRCSPYGLLNRLVKPSGFTLPELLVIIVIVGVFAAVGIQGFFFLVRRARIQAVALEVAGWLEQVRNAAADEVRPNNLQGGCEVNFTSGNRSIGQPIANVVIPALGDCPVPETILNVPPGIEGDLVNVTVQGAPFTFTPRGLWITSSNQPGQTFLLTLRLNNDRPVRCIRLSPVLGSVEIGRPANSAEVTCVNWQRL